MIQRLLVKGKDARDFLNRITAGTVRPLKAGQGSRGFLCAGNARMVGQFDLLCRGEVEFFLACPEACFDDVASELERLYFSEALSFQREGISFGVQKAEGSSLTSEERIFEWNRERDEWPSAVPGFIHSQSSSPSADDFHFSRIGAGVPWPVLDWTKDTSALEAGMLPWVDRNKGCYPGQEVIELSLNVGHPAKAFTAWEGLEELQGGPISLSGGQKAEVLSVARRGGLTRVFLRSPWKARDEAPLVGFRKLFRAEP